MQLEFSEIAKAGFLKIIPDVGKQQTAYASLKWFLLHQGIQYCVPCDAFLDKAIFLYKFGPYRVLFEANERLVIWSFTEHAFEIKS